MINLGLDNLFKEKGFENPNRPAKNFKASGSGFSNLVLGSPRIIIETLDDNHTNVYCRIHLKSGTFKANIDGPEGADPGPEDLAMASYVVNDWYFAFGVDLGTHSPSTDSINILLTPSAQTILTDDDP